MNIKDQKPLPENMNDIDFRIISDEVIVKIFQDRLAEFPTIKGDLEKKWEELLKDLQTDPELKLIDWISTKSSEVVERVRKEYGIIRSKESLETAQAQLLCIYYILLNIDFSNGDISKVDISGGFLLNSADSAEVNLHVKSIAYAIKYIEKYIEENKSVELKVEDLKRVLKTGSISNYAN